MGLVEPRLDAVIGLRDARYGAVLLAIALSIEARRGFGQASHHQLGVVGMELRRRIYSQGRRVFVGVETVSARKEVLLIFVYLLFVFRQHTVVVRI